MPLPLRSLALDEFTGCLLLEAVERELKRLKVRRREHQDGADREGWAFYDMSAFRLNGLANALRCQLRHLSSPTLALQEELARDVVRRRSGMYPTDANRDVLKAERVAKETRTRRSKRSRPAPPTVSQGRPL